MKNMQPMLDDDFDKLFKEKLYSYETEPANTVWAGITEKLDPGKKKRSFPILRIAAASLAAIIGLGIWLAETKEPMKLTAGSDAFPAMREQQEVKAPLRPENSDTNIQPAKPVAEEVEVITSKPKVKAAKALASVSVPSSHKIEIVKAEVDEDTAPSVTMIEEKEKTVTARIRPKEVQALALASETAIQQEEDVLQQKQRRISSVGSLVNFVVSKVDKRKEKIIEFEDGDEGTKVSGLNLGLLKFKAKE